MISCVDFFLQPRLSLQNDALTLSRGLVGMVKCYLTKLHPLLQNHTFMLEEKLTWYVNVFYVMYIFLRPPFLHKTYG